MSSAGKISVTMTPDMLRAVRESVEAGDYASTGEALRDAVRVWQRQRLDDAERLHAIRARIRRSIGDSRLDLTGEDLDAHLNSVVAKSREDLKRA